MASTLLLVAPVAEARTVTLHVSTAPVTWQSTERFAPDDSVAMRVLANGRETGFEHLRGNCVFHWYGRGLVVITNTCGPRLRVRAISLRRTRLTIRYWRKVL